MVNFTINGTGVAGHMGQNILDVANANGIFIPSLCHHKALAPYGSCRICLVEVEKAERKRVVASCSYLVEESIQIDTEAPSAVKARNMAIELLLARCPDNFAIRQMAEKMGVYSSRFESRGKDCILCGLCVRVCREGIGADCIVFSGRGSDRKVMTPYQKPSQQCIGCGACAAICPTQAIDLQEEGIVAVLPKWQTVLQQIACQECGQYFATYRQLDYVQKKLSTEFERTKLCPECRRKKHSAVSCRVSVMKHSS